MTTLKLILAALALVAFAYLAGYKTPRSGKVPDGLYLILDNGKVWKLSDSNITITPNPPRK